MTTPGSFRSRTSQITVYVTSSLSSPLKDTLIDGLSFLLECTRECGHTVHGFTVFKIMDMLLIGALSKFLKAKRDQ